MKELKYNFIPVLRLNDLKKKACTKIFQNKKSLTQCKALNRKCLKYQINYASLTFTAFKSFFPCSRSKVTLSFSLMLSFNPDECTKYSLDVAVSVMNPNPFDSL